MVIVWSAMADEPGWNAAHQQKTEATVAVILPARKPAGEMNRMNCFMNVGIVKPRRLNSRGFSGADFNFAFNALPAAPVLLGSRAYGF
jgi:hypothetical protein